MWVFVQLFVLKISISEIERNQNRKYEDKIKPVWPTPIFFPKSIKTQSIYLRVTDL